MNRKVKIFIIALIAGVLGYGAYKLVNMKYENISEMISSSNVKDVISVSVHRLKYSTLQAQQEFSGTVSKSHRRIIAPDRHSKLVYVNNSGNGNYKKDSLLLKFSVDKLQHDLNKLKLELSSLEEQQKKYEQLNDKGVIPENQLRELETKIKIMKEDMKKIQYDINCSTILAPFDCTVVFNQNLCEGTDLVPGEEVLQIYNTNELIVNLTVEKKYIDLIKNGTPMIKIDDKEISGKVVGISNDEVVKVKFDNGPGVTSDSVNVKFVSEKKVMGFVVNKRAIYNDGKNPYVFVVNNNVAHKMQVTVEKLESFENHVKVFGLKENMLVVLDPIMGDKELYNVEIKNYVD